jgi:uncharacterized protein DUF3788
MLPNAFVGKRKEPADSELTAALGSARILWDQLLDELATRLDLKTHEWNSYSPKAGWSLKIKRGDRTILYMSPCSGSFTASFALGDKAIQAAQQHKLPSRVLKIIREAKRYAEGTAVRFEGVTARDIPAITTIAAAKRDH